MPCKARQVPLPEKDDRHRRTKSRCSTETQSSLAKMELHHQTSKTLNSKRTSYFFPAPWLRKDLEASHDGRLLPQVTKGMSRWNNRTIATTNRWATTPALSLPKARSILFAWRPPGRFHSSRARKRSACWFACLLAAPGHLHLRALP